MLQITSDFNVHNLTVKMHCLIFSPLNHQIVDDLVNRLCLLNDTADPWTPG